MRTAVLGAAAMLTAVAVAGCGSSSSAPLGTGHDNGRHSEVAQTVSSDSGRVTVTGVVRGYGGPLIPTPSPHPAMNGGGLSNQAVTATRSDGSVVKGRTGKDGHFALQLLPGRYQLRASCSQPVHRTVAAEGPAPKVTLQCDFP